MAAAGLGSFRFIFISVGERGREQARVEKSLEKINLATYIHESEDITEAFGRCNKEMRKARERMVEKLILTLVQEGPKGQEPVARKVINGLHCCTGHPPAPGGPLREGEP